MHYQLFWTICLFEYFFNTTHLQNKNFSFRLDPSQTKLKNVSRMMKENSHHLPYPRAATLGNRGSRLRNLWASQVAMSQLAKGTNTLTSSHQRCNLVDRDEYLSLASLVVFQHKRCFDWNIKIHKQDGLKNKLQDRTYSTEGAGCSQSFLQEQSSLLPCQ